MKTTVLVGVTLLSSSAKASYVSCPTATCVTPNATSNVKKDLCFQHDGKQPTDNFLIYSCPWY